MLNKKSLQYLIIALLVSTILTLSELAGFFSLKQDQLSDLLFTKKNNPNRVVIVAIDEQSINKVGQWPWPRSVFGNLVTNLNGAAAIGIDVNFKEPSRLGSQDDLSFSKSLSDSKVPVVLNAEFQPDNSLIKPINSLAEKSLLGFPNLITDSDGNSRVIRFIKNNFPSLSYQLAKTYTKNTKHAELPSPGVIPTRIAYLGPNGHFPTISAIDIISNKIPRQFFENKVVLIGATVSDLQDYHSTPFGVMSGVEIQANAIETLLSQRFFRSSSILNILLIIVLSLLTVNVCKKVRNLNFLIISVFAIFVLYNLIAFLLFDINFLLDLLYPNLAIIISAVATLAYQYFTTSKEKKFIHESFGKYLAPEVINELINNPNMVKLGGQRKNLTIMFSDIRGFTTLSESMQPEELSKFLNLYLTRMTNIILNQKGLVDKYIGDAIMAFWGAPLNNPNHGINAMDAALEMMDSLDEFNKLNLESGRPIDIGIGINTGEVTVGNMGSEKRFDYTVIGDNVNLSSRLEGLNKFYGTNIIVTESTKNLSNRGSALFRELDKVKVKGKNEAVKIFELVTNSKKPEVSLINEDFISALHDYYNGDFNKAADKFQKILQRVPEDKPSQKILERCQELISHPPLTPWKGVWELTSK